MNLVHLPSAKPKPGRRMVLYQMQNRCHSVAGRGRGHVRRQDVDGGDLSPASAQRDLRHAEAQQHHPRRLHRKKLRQG